MINNDNYILITVKSLSILTLFLIIVIVGNIPYKSKTFRDKNSAVAISQAFSGGLFLSVALLHLLPEAQAQFETITDQSKENFPFPYLITIISFASILFIEKIITNHKHLHSEHVDIEQEKSSELLSKSQQSVCCSQIGACCNQVESQLQEDELIQAISSQRKLAQRVGFNDNQQKKQVGNLKKKKKPTNLTPYFLQLAVGIHAIFEGLAIGIESNPNRCVGIALAVFCHKWAEGLTLGLAFKKGKVSHSRAKKLILLQALMNPIGISVGWILSQNGNLVVGIFYSISAGTFLYISTIEVIVEEFNISKYKAFKFLAFTLAIAFVSSIWFIEQIDF